MKTKQYQKGEVIFRQGDYARTMYDVLSGSVGIFVAYETENEKQLTTLSPGQFLGEMGMIDAFPRSATAVAMEDGTQLQEIDEKEFSDYFKEQSPRLLAIMRQLSQRIRERTEDYEDACRTLDELRKTKGTPEKRSGSLKERIREIVDFYNLTMGCMPSVPYEGISSGYSYIPYNTESRR